MRSFWRGVWRDFISQLSWEYLAMLWKNGNGWMDACMRFFQQKKRQTETKVSQCLLTTEGVILDMSLWRRGSESTDFNALCEQHWDYINVMTKTLADYMNLCVEIIIPTLTVSPFPNYELWINSDLKKWLNVKRKAFREGDRELIEEYNSKSPIISRNTPITLYGVSVSGKRLSTENWSVTLWHGAGTVVLSRLLANNRDDCGF